LHQITDRARHPLTVGRWHVVGRCVWTCVRHVPRRSPLASRLARAACCARCFSALTESRAALSASRVTRRVSPSSPPSPGALAGNDTTREPALLTSPVLDMAASGLLTVAPGRRPSRPRHRMRHKPCEHPQNLRSQLTLLRTRHTHGAPSRRRRTAAPSLRSPRRSGVRVQSPPNAPTL